MPIGLWSDVVLVCYGVRQNSISEIQYEREKNPDRSTCLMSIFLIRSENIQGWTLREAIQFTGIGTDASTSCTEQQTEQRSSLQRERQYINSMLVANFGNNTFRQPTRSLDFVGHNIISAEFRQRWTNLNGARDIKLGHSCCRDHENPPKTSTNSMNIVGGKGHAAAISVYPTPVKLQIIHVFVCDRRIIEDPVGVQHFVSIVMFLLTAGIFVRRNLNPWDAIFSYLKSKCCDKGPGQFTLALGLEKINEEDLRRSVCFVLHRWQSRSPTEALQLPRPTLVACYSLCCLAITISNRDICLCLK